MKPFLEISERGGVLVDGAMGTMLYQRGVFVNRCFELVSLEQPEMVRHIHEQYVQAGAKVLTANTFAANRLKLDKFGISDRFEEINRASVRLAREAAGGRALVAGSVGPTGVGLAALAGQEGLGTEATLKEHIDILVESGVDLIILETFDVVQELELAIRLAKAHEGIPVVALCMFGSDGKTKPGTLSPRHVAQRLVAAGADVIGANCGGGPDLILSVAERMVGHGKPVLAMANAGFPKNIEGRTIYLANPEYFGVFAQRLFTVGVKLVGGCCGTTPEHIRLMGNTARMFLATHTTETGTLGAEITVTENKERALAQCSDLGMALSNGSFVTSVELNPPAGLSLDKRVEAAKALRDFGVTTINIADGPRATVRMGNVAMAVRIAAETGLQPLVHVCCRDRNYLGLQSHLLGMHVLGLRNLVVITGDPPKMGPFPHATGVYDVNSIGLLNMINSFNHGLDPGGREMPNPTQFLCATGAEPASLNYERELQRLEMKRNAGADVVMTQPVYDPYVVEKFLDDTARLNIPVMLGLCPLASLRNALFLHENIPGMQVPKYVLERMADADEKGGGQAEGIAIAREMLEAVRDRIQGAYVMPPFGRHKVAMALLDGFVERPEKSLQVVSPKSKKRDKATSGRS